MDIKKNPNFPQNSADNSPEQSSVEKPVDSVSHDKSPEDQRREKLSQINTELQGYNSKAGSEQEVRDIEKVRNDEYQQKKAQLEGELGPLSSKSDKLIHRNMVADVVAAAHKENKRFNDLKIRKIVLENIGNPESKLLKRLFPFNPGISEGVFFESLEKICGANIDVSVGERVGFFRKALEYFNEEEHLRVPIGHATGSDALKLIIESGSIKEGGTGEHGEGPSQSRYESQEGISVARMGNAMSDFVELFYARMAANKKITSDDLKIDADAIDEGSSIVNDIVDVSLQSMSKEEILSSIAESMQSSSIDVMAEISRESGKAQEEITKDDIGNSNLLKKSLSRIFDEGRKHYITEENLQRDYNAFTSIIEQCERGEFPKIIYENKKIERPEDIIKINLPLLAPASENEKILQEIHQKYNEWLSEKHRNKNSATYSLDELHENKSKVLKEFADFIKGKRNILEKHLKDKERLKELGNQFPCIIIAEGKESPTFSAKYGKKPVHYFEAEERILADISLDDVAEIVVPQKRIEEVRKWLESSPSAKEGKKPRLIPFEYFEIKRLINHQLGKLVENE